MINYVTVSKPEDDLIQAMKKVGFGELLFIEIGDAPKTQKREVDKKTLRLLEFIREGNTCLDSVKIHQGEPTQVVITGEHEKLKYKKKIQL